MTPDEINRIQPGTEVVVLKSGKIYRCLCARRSWTTNAGTGWTPPTFRQLRANKAGAIGLYGPSFVTFKPENVAIRSIPAAPAKTWHDDIKERADFEESAHRGDYP